MVLPAFPLLPQPAILTSQQAAAINAQVAAIFNQVLQNPLALLAGPISIPNSLAEGISQKVQAGSLSPHTTGIATPFSGVFVALASVPTPIAGGQLINQGPGTVGVVSLNDAANAGIAGSPKNPQNPYPLPPGIPFNLGSVDLSSIWIGGIQGNQGQGQVLAYYVA